MFFRLAVVGSLKLARRRRKEKRRARVELHQLPPAAGNHMRRGTRAAQTLRAAAQPAAARPLPSLPLPSPPMPSPPPAAEPSWAAWVDGTVSALAEQRLLRSLRPLTPDPGCSRRVVLSAPSPQRLTVFADNDYLGLSSHPEVRAAAAAAAAEHGCGPRSSALVCGHTEWHESLARRLARLKHADACELFPTGFAANAAVLGALATSPGCAIFSDALNHASIVDGARLAAKGAGAALHIYRHNDLAHLERLLSASAAPRKLIVSDSVCSTGGALALQATSSRRGV